MLPEPAACQACPLSRCRKVPGQGPLPADLLVIGEAPGPTETLQGAPFVGRSGEVLDALLAEFGWKREDTRVTNITLCLSCGDDGKPEKPPAVAQKQCRERLRREILRTRPRAILALGKTSAQALGGRGRMGEMANLMTFKRDLLESGHDCWVMPTWHPAACLRGRDDWFEELYDAVRRIVDHLKGRLPWPTEPDFQTVVCDDKPSALEACRAVINATDPIVSLDLETSGLRHTRDHIILAGWYVDGKAYTVQWEHINKAMAQLMLEDQRITWVLHNSAFDLRFLKAQGLDVSKMNVADTMCLAMALSENHRSVGLKALARRHCNAPPYDDGLAAHIRKGDWSTVPLGVLIPYLALDVYYTRQLYDILSICINQQKDRRQLWKLIRETLLPAQRLICDLETQGVGFDAEYARGLKRIWEPRVEAAGIELQDYAARLGFDARKYKKGTKKFRERRQKLCPGSPKQLAGLVYDILRLPMPRDYKGKPQRTTGKLFLEAYPNQPVVKLIKDYRQMKKILGTYVDGIMDDVWSDGRLHPSFILAGTATGRIVIKDPPLQTLPSEGKAKEQLGSIKRMIVPTRPSRLILEADYSQLEMRIAWHYSKDVVLGDAIRDDIHMATALRMFPGCGPQDITSDMRRKAKSVNFGVIYGMGPKLLADATGSTIEEARAWIAAFFRAYSGYAQWYEMMAAQAVEQGELITPVGRKRHWRLITRDNYLNIQRQAVNFPIQSFAADICLGAAGRVNTMLQEQHRGRVLLTVHDSIVAEVERDGLDETVGLVLSEMRRMPVPSCAELKVDHKVGAAWGSE